MEEVFVELSTHPGYFISNTGRFRKGNAKILATHTTKKGYKICAISQDGIRRSFFVHRLVAQAFIGSLDGKEVNHKDFNKENNCVENLEIVSRLENMQHYHADERSKEVYARISKSKTKPESERKQKIYVSSGRHRGGYRGGHRPKLPPGEKRVTVSVCLDQDVQAYRIRVGREWSNIVNALVRAKIETE